MREKKLQLTNDKMSLVQWTKEDRDVSPFCKALMTISESPSKLDWPKPSS